MHLQTRVWGTDPSASLRPRSVRLPIHSHNREACEMPYIFAPYSGTILSASQCGERRSDVCTHPWMHSSRNSPLQRAFLPDPQPATSTQYTAWRAPPLLRNVRPSLTSRQTGITAQETRNPRMGLYQPKPEAGYISEPLDWPRPHRQLSTGFDPHATSNAAPSSSPRNSRNSLRHRNARIMPMPVLVSQPEW